MFDALTALKVLEVNGNQISSLPSSIFDTLSKLEQLDLSNNSFTSFEADDFAALPSLKLLLLYGNTMVTSLPEDLFENNPALTGVGLSRLSITTLPSDIFDGLSSLENINLSDSVNQSLTSLPADIFDGLSSLKGINLYQNGLTSLPDGIFKGVPQLLILHLGNQPNGNFSMNISLVADGTGQFKASYPVGAVIETKVRVTVNNGTIDGETANSDGTWTITISQGSVDSDTFTVSRTSGTTGAVSVYINSLNAVNKPSSHTGYVLANQTPSNSPLEIYAAGAGAPIKSATPTVTSMLPNFPNPFNPETWIPYQLSKASDVTLTIFNMRGVVVRELALGHKPAGYYSTRKRAAYWDGRNDIGERVAVGVYFCTFKAGDFSTTRKMLLRK